MKLIRIFCFIILTTLLVGSASAYSADSYITINGFVFDIDSDGNAVIHEYDGSSGKVVIPQKLLGADVTAIDDYAFFGNTDITSVSFENASKLKKVGTNAFYGCGGLKELHIPSWITEISFGAFQDCTALEQVIIDNGVTSLPEQLFLNCSSLRTLKIPDSVTKIGNTALGGCDKLTISCSNASYALEYAEGHNISVVVANDYLGDTTLDGKVNISDATAVQKYRASLTKLSNRALSAADVNRDGSVTVRDATFIQMYLAGYSVPYPIGELVD